MKRVIKYTLGAGAVAIIGTCFTLGLMQGMIEQDKKLDTVRAERCNSLPWPRPAQCAMYAQVKELSPAAGKK